MHLPQVYDTSGLSCSNDGNASVNIAHSTGRVPNGTVYGTHVSEVDSSDGGQFEHTITDLTPGNVSENTFWLRQIFFYPSRLPRTSAKSKEGYVQTCQHTKPSSVPSHLSRPAQPRQFNQISLPQCTLSRCSIPYFRR